jgi:nucleoside 2-deoxyribosyltransferase
MSFAKEIMAVQQMLENSGHSVFAPDGATDYVKGHADKTQRHEGAKRKIARDLIKQHHSYIESSDAVLVLNYDKKGIKNYVGGNAFLEMGFAFVLGKPIFMLNEEPDIDMIKEEIIAMQPIVLHGDLTQISEKIDRTSKAKNTEIRAAAA